MKNSALRRWATVLTLAGLSGCAVGPDFHPPAAPAVTGYSQPDLPLPAATASAATTGGVAQQFAGGLPVPAQWWTQFGSAPLNAVVARALKASPDLQSAQAALRAANELVLAQQGSYFPAVGLSLMPTRQKTTEAAGQDPSVFNLHTAQVNVSYALDATGNTRQVESIEAQAALQRYQLQATELALVSNVVVAAVQEASLRAQIEATEVVVDLQRQLLTLLQHQYRLGDIADAAIAAQEAAMAQTEAGLPPLQKALAQQRDRLIALTGGFPSEGLPERFDLAQLQLPQQLPVSLPSRLVRQRPDVMAAEAQLHTASAAVGIATANMLPQFNLSASFGSAADGIGGLFTSGTGLWSIAAGLTQPLFAGGMLLHKKRASEALLEQADAQYRGAVILAFQNVADSLLALQYDAQTLRVQLQAERAAARSLAISKKSVQLGATNPQTLLLAQQLYQQALISLVQAQAARFADTAALFQALGGSWDDGA